MAPNCGELLPDQAPDHPLLNGRKEIGRGESTIVLDGDIVDGQERVFKVLSSPTDYAYYTALPRLPFTGFTHVRLPDPTAGQPEIAFGKFRDDGGRSTVPVGLQVNHLFVDGADLGDLYDAAAGAFARGL